MSTDKTRPIQGYREPEQPSKDNPVDPDKFQQELKKVTESDESQKKKQRNLKKRDEEGGDTDEEAAAAAGPTVVNAESFATFMGHGDALDSAFSVKSPQNVQTIQTTSSGETFTLDANDTSARLTSTPELPQEAPPTPSFGAEQSSAAPPGTFFTAPESPPPTQAAPQTPAPTLPQAPSEPAATSPTFPGGFVPSEDFLQTESPIDESQITEPSSPQQTQERAVAKPKPEDQSLYARKGPSVAQKQKKTFPSKELKIETVPSKGLTAAKPIGKGEVPPQKPIVPGSKPIITEPGLQPPIQEMPAQKSDVTQEAKQTFFEQAQLGQASGKLPKPSSETKKLEGAAKTGETSKEEMPLISRKETPDEGSKKDSKEGEKEKQPDDIILQPNMQAAAPFDILPTITPPAPSAYSSLPPQLLELFDKMVGLITVQQSTGITTTTVTLNMPNSIFNGAQIVLDHYAMAPNSFNVQLIGTPKAVDLFNSRMGELVAAMEQNKQNFQINMQRPILLEDYRAFKRKEKSSGDEGKKDRRQQG